MTRFLAIDTSTEACSVALGSAGDCEELFELAPRKHNQRVFVMLERLLGSQGLVGAGLDALVYSAGPGSFTGLRVGASAVQGLAFSARLPVLAVPTLTALAYTALRRGLANSSAPLLAVLDAKVGEVYWQLFDITGDHCAPRDLPQVCAPQDLPITLAPDELEQGLRACGDGLVLLDDFPAALQTALTNTRDGKAAVCWPCAQDLLRPAQRLWDQGQTQRPEQVAPVYVRDEISWKKLSEQGPRRGARP